GETGQTPGKRLVGTKLVSEATLQPVGVGVALGRYFITIVGVLTYCIANLIDALFPLWDPKKQRLVDKVFKTVVIVVPKQNFSFTPPRSARTSTRERAPSRRRPLSVQPLRFSSARNSCGTAPTAGCAAR